MEANKDPSIGWMYDGAKSDVNREDYLLGKKVDKNFEKYSDVVNDEKPTQFDTLLQTRTVDTSTVGSGLKKSSLQKDIIKSEDPFVAVKVREETKRRELMENPLMKMKLQKMLKDMMHSKKDDSKKNKKKKKDKKSKKKRKEKSGGSSSSEDSDSHGSRKSPEKKRRRLSSDGDRKRSQISPSSNSKRKDSSKSPRRRDSRRSGSPKRRDDSRRSRSPQTRDESRSPKRRYSRRSRSPQTRDESRSSRSPRRRDPKRSRSPKRRDDSRSPKRRDSRRSRSPKRRDDSRSPKRRDSRRSRSPQTRDESRSSRSPRRRDPRRSRSPKRRDDSRSPKRKESRRSPKHKDSSRENDSERSRKIMKNESRDNRDQSSSWEEDKLEPSSSKQKSYDAHIPKHLLNAHSTDVEQDDKSEGRNSDYEENDSKVKGYGLVEMRKRTEEDKKRDESKGSLKLIKLPTGRENQKRERRKLTEEEKAARLAEMQENAKWRDDVRSSNMLKRREEEKKELEEMEKTGYAPSFIRTQMNNACEDMTVEKRLQSNKKGVQRSHGYMDRSFAKR